MLRFLDYRIVRAADDMPLAILESSLGNGHEIRPDALRALATRLLAIADEAEGRDMGRGYREAKNRVNY
jgi:hypothetical protein